MQYWQLIDIFRLISSYCFYKNIRPLYSNLLQLPILHPYGSLAAVFANCGAVLESSKVGYACALRRIAKGANARVVECRVQNYMNVWKSPPFTLLVA